MSFDLMPILLALARDLNGNIQSKVVLPHRFIEWEGEQWVEVEWPSDGRYDIGFQLAQQVDGAMRLFELASRRIKMPNAMLTGRASVRCS